MGQIQRQIPNILTVLRIPLALLCAYFAIFSTQASMALSLTLFLAAAATDFLDGYLARKWNIVTNFGKIIDPIADKVLILGVLIVFTYKGLVPIIMTIIIAFREIGLTAIRLLLLPKKVVLASRYSGKIKTFSQVGVIVLIYLMLIFKTPLTNMFTLGVFSNIILLLMIWIFVITIYSGIEFLFFNQKALEKL